MTVYFMRYATDGDSSHKFEAFRNEAEAKKRYDRLKKEAEAELKTYDRSNGEFPPVELFDAPFDSYLRKASVETVSDLIKLINSL